MQTMWKCDFGFSNFVSMNVRSALFIPVEKHQQRGISIKILVTIQDCSKKKRTLKNSGHIVNLDLV